MYTPKFSKSSYKSLGQRRKIRVCRVLATSNDSRVATYETSRSPSHMVLEDMFLDGVHNECNNYRVVPWLHESYEK